MDTIITHGLITTWNNTTELAAQVDSGIANAITRAQLQDLQILMIITIAIGLIMIVQLQKIARKP